MKKLYGEVCLLFHKSILIRNTWLLSKIWIGYSALFSSSFSLKAKNERILNIFRNTISCNLKLPMCKNCMNFADTDGVYKYHHFGVKIIEIGTPFLKLSGKYEVLWGQPKTLKTPKTCLIRDVGKMT